MYIIDYIWTYYREIHHLFVVRAYSFHKNKTWIPLHHKNLPKKAKKKKHQTFKKFKWLGHPLMIQAIDSKKLKKSCIDLMKQPGSCVLFFHFEFFCVRIFLICSEENSNIRGEKVEISDNEYWWLRRIRFWWKLYMNENSCSNYAKKKVKSRKHINSHGTRAAGSPLVTW
jgi:hypothetical protein